MTTRPMRSRTDTTGETSGQGSQFVRYFGPLLDALRELGESGTPDEVVERVAKNLQLPGSVLSETANHVTGTRFNGLGIIALLENLQLGVRPVQTFEGDEALFDGFRSDRRQ